MFENSGSRINAAISHPSALGQLTKNAPEPLTTVLGQSINSLRGIEARLEGLLARIQSHPEAPKEVAGGVPAPSFGAVEAGSQIRNATNRIGNLVAQLDDML